MGLMTAAMLTLGVVIAGQQVSAGYAKKEDTAFNASIIEHEAEVIEGKKGFESYKYDRLKGQYSAMIMARTGKAGLAFSGSPLAVYTDVNTQIEMDKLIGQYNLDVQKSYKYAEAEQYRRTGRRAVTAGYTDAFSTLLQTTSLVAGRL